MGGVNPKCLDEIYKKRTQEKYSQWDSF